MLELKSLNWWNSSKAVIITSMFNVPAVTCPVVLSVHGVPDRTFRVRVCSSHQTAALMIFMTHSLIHWQTLTRGAPRSPILPSSRPADDTRHRYNTHSLWWPKPDQETRSRMQRIMGRGVRDTCDCWTNMISENLSDSETQTSGLDHYWSVSVSNESSCSPMVAEKMTMPRTFICWLLPGLVLYMISGGGVSSRYTVRPLGSLSSGTT